MNQSSKIIFDENSRVAPLGVIALESASELGKKINGYLMEWAKEGGANYETFLVESACPRFSSGDAKGIIKESVRGKDLFLS